MVVQLDEPEREEYRFVRLLLLELREIIAKADRYEENLKSVGNFIVTRPFSSPKCYCFALSHAFVLPFAFFLRFSSSFLLAVFPSSNITADV